MTPGQPDAIVDSALTSSYECGEDFVTVTTTVTTTEYIANDEGGWEVGQPVVAQTSEQVAHEVVACEDNDVNHNDRPTHPNTPSVPTEVKGQTAVTTSSQPGKPSRPTRSQAPGHTTPAVPLSIDAGL
jgi:hypothetical protein